MRPDGYGREVSEASQNEAILNEAAEFLGWHWTTAVAVSSNL